MARPRRSASSGVIGSTLASPRMPSVPNRCRTGGGSLAPLQRDTGPSSRRPAPFAFEASTLLGSTLLGATLLAWTALARARGAFALPFDLPLALPGPFPDAPLVDAR